MGFINFFTKKKRVIKSDNGAPGNVWEKNPWSLDRPLGQWSPSDSYLLRHAVEQIAIFGEIGAAKSTGSGAWLLMNFLRARMGGLFNAIESGDAGIIEAYLHMAGAEDKLILVEPSSDPQKRPRWRCNLLKYALLTAGSPGSRVEQVVSVLMTMVEAAERGEKNGAQDKFWMRSVRQLRATSCRFASRRGTVTIKDDPRRPVMSARSHEEVQDETFQAGSFLYRLIVEAEAKAAERRARAERLRAGGALCAARVSGHAERYKGSVIASYSVLADILLRGDVADLFDADTNFIPDLTFEGAVICLNLPPKVHGQAGVYAQAAFTYLWQLAAERCDLERYPRAVWWFLDEAAELVGEYTPRFLATGRSKKIASVLICQNLSNYFAAFGGESGRHHVEALLGNTGVKVLHANGHAQTNEWVSKMISDEIQTRYSFQSGNQHPGHGGGSETVGHKVLPSEFTMLKKGGPQNGFRTQAIVYQTARASRPMTDSPICEPSSSRSFPSRPSAKAFCVLTFRDGLPQAAQTAAGLCPYVPKRGACNATVD